MKRKDPPLDVQCNLWLSSVNETWSSSTSPAHTATEENEMKVWMLIGNPVKLPDSAARHPKGAELWVLFLTNSVWREREGGGLWVCFYVWWLSEAPFSAKNCCPPVPVRSINKATDKVSRLQKCLFMAKFLSVYLSICLTLSPCFSFYIWQCI